MAQRKQCLRCGAHDYGRVCGVCGSVEMKILPAGAGRGRFSKKRDPKAPIDTRR